MAMPFTRRKGMRRILFDQRCGAAEAFMDCEMELVECDIMELSALIRMNTPWDRGAKLLDKGWFGRRSEWVTTRIGSINRQRRSRANVKQDRKSTRLNSSH